MNPARWFRSSYQEIHYSSSMSAAGRVRQDIQERIRCQATYDGLLHFRVFDSLRSTCEDVIHVKFYNNNQLAISIDDSPWSEPHGHWEELPDIIYRMQFRDDKNEELWTLTFRLLDNTEVYVSQPYQRFLLIPWKDATPEPVRIYDHCVDLRLFEKSLQPFNKRLHDNKNVLQFRMYRLFTPIETPTVSIKFYANHEIAIKVGRKPWSTPHGYWYNELATTYDIKWQEEEAHKCLEFRFELIFHTQVLISVNRGAGYYLIPWVDDTIDSM